MRAEIHPKYEDSSILCACGSEFKTRSTKGDYKIDICSSCHPYYKNDGSHRMIDSAGRIDKFRRRYEKKS